VREKFGVAVSAELVDELDVLVDECADLGASRSEIVEASSQRTFDQTLYHTARVQELIIRRRKGTR
jgi:metal-responsive CopG/Arc/MetJ family transcriptional regulator